MKKRLFYYTTEYVLPTLMVIVIAFCIQFFINQRGIVLRKYPYIHAPLTHAKYPR